MSRSSAGPPAGRLIALAERNPRRAGLLARRAAPEGLGAPERLALGWALLRWERLDEAEAHLEAAARRAADRHLALACAHGLLTIRRLRGEGPELQAAWEEHVAACRAAGAGAAAASARCEQIAHLNFLGRSGAARDLAAACAELVRASGDEAGRLRYLHVVGAVAIDCGDLEAAEQALAAALAGYERLRRRADAARVRLDRAWLWLRREQLARAEADLNAARAAFLALDLPLRVAICERNLGEVARFGGDYGRAIGLAVAARERFAALGHLMYQAGCELNLGAVAHVSGLHELALAVYRRAQALYEQIGNRRFGLICRRNQALTLCRLGRAAEALELLAELAPHVEALDDRLEAAELLVTRAEARRELGNLALALADLREAHRRFSGLGSGPAAAECLLDMGWLHLDRAALYRAVDCLREAAAGLAERPAHRWRALYGLGRAAEQLGAPEEALGHYAAAVDLVAGLRRRLASEHGSSGVFHLAAQLHADALRLAADLGRAEELLLLAERQRALAIQRQAASQPPSVEEQPRRAQAAALLRESLRAIAGPADLEAAAQRYLADLFYARHADSIAAPAAAPPDLARLRDELSAAHGDDWSLLAPMIVGTELLIAALTPAGARLERRPLGPAERTLISHTCHPEHRLTAYRDLARLRNPALPAWTTLQAMGDLLLPRWLRERLHPGHRLLIAPSGPLHGLAWAALRLDGAWLCERAVIQLIPGLALQPDEPAPGQALLIACADFGQRAPPLPLAPQTLAIAAGHWPGPTRRLEGPAAGRAALLELNQQGELARYGLIHIASHAQLGAAGLLAHIKLADDDLLLDEVLQLRLGGALVVLAACEGGAGEVLPGEEVLGLGRALLASGAAGVVASLWPVYDAGVLALLEPLYRHLAAADAAAALAHAQRALLSHPDGEPQAILRSPLVWGGFAVSSGRPLGPSARPTSAPAAR